MGNEWQIGLLIAIVLAIFLIVYLNKRKAKTFIIKIEKLVLSAIAVFGIFVGIMFIIDDTTSDIGDGNDYDYQQEYVDKSGDNSNPSFQASRSVDAAVGKPCQHRGYSDIRACDDQGKCYGGFARSSSDPTICRHCRHSYKEHYD